MIAMVNAGVREIIFCFEQQDGMCGCVKVTLQLMECDRGASAKKDYHSLREGGPFLA